MQPFDQRDGKIWIDNKLVPWNDAKIHFLTHGLHYASSVFEGIAVYEGKIFKALEHMERLHFSAQMLGFDIPFSPHELKKAAEDIVRANNLQNAYIRPCAWQGSEMMRIYGPQNKIHIAIAGWAMSYKHFTDKMRGIRLVTSTWAIPAPHTAPVGTKSAGIYMIYTLSQKLAQEKGFDNALMLDWQGHVAEAASANIFFIIDGALHTPIPDCFLNGITRKTVIELAKEQGISVIERVITPQEMADAQEVFITGTAAEILPVRQIDEHHFTPGNLCEKIITLYAQKVHHDLS